MVAAADFRRLGRRFIMLDNLLVVSGFYLVFPLISLHFVDQLAWSAGVVGLALGLRQLSQQGLGTLGGSLADRFGVKPLIIVGMLLRAAGFATMALARSPAMLIVSCILSGLGGSLFDPARSALLAKLTRPHERNRLYSLLMMQDSAAGMLGALLGSYLLGLDFYWVAMAGCAVFVLAAASNAVLLPAYRPAARRASPWTSIRAVLADRPYVLLVLTLSGYYALSVQIMLLVPVVVKQLAGSARAVGWMYCLDGLLALGLLYPMARLGERYLSLETRILAGISLMSASLLAMSAVHGFSMALCALTLFYIGALITEPAREQLLARHAKAHARATYMGMGKIGFALGGLAGYTGGGYLLDRGLALHLPALPWLALSAVGAATVLALYLQFFPVGRLAPSIGGSR